MGIREIKFRALIAYSSRIPIPGGYSVGQWIVGGEIHLYHTTVGPHIHFGPLRFPVDPKSISQFTGIRDKNGKEIYEGDALRLGDHFYLVVWRDCGFMGKQLGASSFIGLTHNKDHMEVVSDIWDNDFLSKVGGSRRPSLEDYGF